MSQHVEHCSRKFLDGEGEGDGEGHVSQQVGGGTKSKLMENIVVVNALAIACSKWGGEWKTGTENH
jgi:hypothetical protein